MIKRWSASLVRSPALWPLAGILALTAINLAHDFAIAHGPDGEHAGFLSLAWRDGHLFGTTVDILNHGALAMMTALGMTLVIATGGVDLSVGSVMAISAVTAGQLFASGHGFITAVVAALVTGLLCGLLNGALVAVARIQPIVATLTLMVAGRGLAELISGDKFVPIAHAKFMLLGNGFVLGLPFAPVFVMLVYLAAWAGLRGTATGLMVEATGDNETASRFAGLATARMKFLAYVVCGLLAAGAGLFAASNIRGADPFLIGQNMELDAIFAVVAGGTVLSGGRFHLLGSFMGALLLQTLTTTMFTLGVPPDIAPVPKAVLIIVLCLAQSETARGRLRALFPRKAASA